MLANNHFLISELTPEHLPLIHKLQIELTGGNDSDLFVFPDSIEQRKIINQTGKILGSFINKNLIAYIMCRFYATGSKCYNINIDCFTMAFVNILVAPSFRNCGIMKTLCQSLENIAKQENCQQIIVSASPNNKISLRFLQKNGFSIAKTTTLYGDKLRYVLRKVL